MDSRKTYESVDAYIADHSEETKPFLAEIRQLIRSTIPQAQETISYGMPAYKMHGVLVYFAANKNHIGFYPTASPIEIFKDELAIYKTSKGAIQFPLKSGIPADLVRKIVLFRLHEDEEKFSAKKKK